LLLVLLILPFCAVLMPATASADAKFTTKSLSSLLVTKDELSDLVKVTDSLDIDPGTDPIAVGRVYSGKDMLVDVSLFSPDDGSKIRGAMKDRILSADSLRKFADSMFTKVRDFEDVGDVLGDDYAATFTGTFDGKVYNVSEIVFVKDNIFGLAVYATIGENDPTNLGLIYGMQLAKLP
jgi:hypothetical protein